MTRSRCLVAAPVAALLAILLSGAGPDDPSTPMLSFALGWGRALFAPSPAQPAPDPAAAAVPDGGTAVGVPAPAMADGAGDPGLATVPPPDPGPIFQDADLAPYFASGNLLAARARYEAGLPGDAYALLQQESDDAPPVAYLKAMVALDSGRVKEGVERMAALAPRYPALADRISWYEGYGRERTADHRGSAAAYARIQKGSVLFAEARLGEARVRRRFDGKGALTSLAQVTEEKPPFNPFSRDVAAEALLLTGELLAVRGDQKAARTAYMRIWAEHPLSRQAEDARQRADALVEEEPTKAQRLSRAQAFLGAQKNREASGQLEELLAELKLPDPVACEAQYALGRAYRKMREHAKAIQTLDPVTRSGSGACKDRSLRAKALYILGQSAAIVAQKKGIAVYEALARDYPEHSFADDALLFVADLQMKAKDAPKARDALRRLVERYPDGDFRADALFRLYWLDREEGLHEQGLAQLRLLEKDYGPAPDSLDLERSLYWQGRTLVALDRKVEAAATWEKLIREHPAGYYAMLARGRLPSLDMELAAAVEAALPDPPAILPPLELHTGALLADPHYAAAIELLRLGFPKAAVDELWAIDRAKAREQAGAEPVLLVAFLLDKADARPQAHHIARTELKELLRGRPESEGAVPFRIAYPLAFRDLIERHAAKYEVPPDLMQALMREESSLDPNVVSWAGAIGLTQLMPSTARRVAAQLKLGSPSEDALRDPDLNVRIGTAYLGNLLKMWKGDPALACASYNAGEGAVGRWLKDRGAKDLDEFVEEIPIKETRDYVKRVLKSFNAYRLTYGKGDERFLALAPAKADPKTRR